MKHTVVSKFIGILLAACALVTAICAACGIALMGSLNLYTSSFEESKNIFREDRAVALADMVLDRHTAQTLGNCTQEALEAARRNSTDAELTEQLGLRPESWAYRISDENDKVVGSSENWLSAELKHTYEFTMSGTYPVDIPEEKLSGTDVSQAQYREFYYVSNQLHYLYYFNTPEYTVSIAMANDALEHYNRISESLLQRLFQMRYSTIAVMAVGLLLFAISMVYLCCAAGKTKQDAEPSPGGLNRIPLDLYLVVAAGSCAVLCWFALRILDEWFINDSGLYNYGTLALVVLALLAASLFGVGFLFAVAAQMKPKGLYWLKHSVVGFLGWQLWRAVRFCFRGLSRLAGMMPVIWKWMLMGLCMGFFPVVFTVIAAAGWNGGIFLLFLSVLVDIGIVCYGAYAYGTVLSGAKRMAQGDLDAKIPTEFLLGSYKKCAQDLNDLAAVATLAARNQMKSERMKTELITNVSHDIKTPLTSIINYVDLLEKPHTPEQRQQYLEVLGRQSQRMKKLIEDLVQMSKATTGNMTVEIAKIDAVETVNQALGEFADKLEKARLMPVFHEPEQTVYMMADGKLTWRVLSNVLSNAVKYALPDTRLYVDVIAQNGKVLISLKNISREELNVSADELTERFVRGDASRNSEGSGLGLNIAKSLMELQRGGLELVVDGDLFKVTLIFSAQ